MQIIFPSTDLQIFHCSWVFWWNMKAIKIGIIKTLDLKILQHDNL